MKRIILAAFILFTATASFADEPRTVGVYKRHIQSEDHSKGDFDHTLHHMRYLSGVSDTYTVINRQRKGDGKEPLY